MIKVKGLFVAVSMGFFGLLIGTHAYADENEATKESTTITFDVGDNAKELIKGGGMEAKEIIAMLNKELTPIYIKQVKTEAIASLCYSMVWILLFVATFVLSLRIHRHYSNQDEDTKKSRECGRSSDQLSAESVCRIFMVLSAVIITIIASGSISGNLDKLVNPEYTAFTRAIEHVSFLK